MNVEEFCPICNGDAQFIGTLGKSIWFRCSCCGIDFSIDKKRRGPVK